MPDREVIRQQMRDTCSSLSDKLQTLEQQVVDTVTGANAAVSETVASVKDAVHDTVDSVKGAVRNTVESVKETFDLSAQTRRHPWLFFGGAVFAGYIGGRLLGSGAPAPQWPPPRRAGRPAPMPNGVRTATAVNGKYPAEGEVEVTPPNFGKERRESNWLSQTFGAELDKLKSIAVGAGMALARDMVAQRVSGQVGRGLVDVINDITAKLGGELYREPLFTPQTDVQEEPALTGESDGSGRISAAHW